jgi:hypothetical protein
MLRTRVRTRLCLNITAGTSLDQVFYFGVKLGDIVKGYLFFVNLILPHPTASPERITPFGEESGNRRTPLNPVRATYEEAGSAPQPLTLWSRERLEPIISSKGKGFCH